MENNFLVNPSPSGRGGEERAVRARLSGRYFSTGAKYIQFEFFRGRTMGKSHDETLWLICPACKSRVAYRAESGLAGTRCTGCGEAVGMLDETEIPTGWKSRGAIADEDFQPSMDDDEYKVSAWVEPIRPASEPIATVPIVVKPNPKAFLHVEINPPPRPLYIAGVFSFPWRRRSIVPWLVISIGSMLFGLITVVAIGGLLSGSAQGAIAAGAAVLVLVWVGLLTFSYAAACLFSVVDMTTYNYDLDEDWPEPDWRERVWPLAWVLWLMFLANVPGFVAAYASGATLGAIWSLQVVAVAILFPFLLLSSLEADSFFIPLSPPIARSLLSEGLSWLGFYALTMCLIAGWSFLTVEGFFESPYLAIIVTAPVFGALVLIYARLVGRLAWKIMRPGELKVEAWRRSRDRQTSQENPAHRDDASSNRRSRGVGK